MTSLSSPARALLLPALLLGLSAGCAARRGGEGVAPDRRPASTVSAEDIENAPGEPLESLLAGRIAGVRVTRAPDGGIAVRIRGTSSINGSNEPLYLLDGVPIQPGPGGALAGINPHDIESIEVLKDVASTTMWGSRGANGVISIKTKKPKP
jgi:TonB-dependent SusC/RagA subfamily outer membrane receptor